MTLHKGVAVDHKRTILIRIKAPHFVAGCVAEEVDLTKPSACDYFKITRECAPILRWTVGKGLLEIEEWCEQKGYTMETYAIFD